MPRLRADKDTAERILSAVRSIELSPHSKPRFFRRPHLYTRVHEFGKADAQIAAMSTGGTAGSGTVSIYTMTTAGVTSDTGDNLTAYNLSLDAVAAGRWLQVKRHERTGLWLIDFEDCGST